MAKTGSAKGVPKPKKNLDPEFGKRLKAAMRHGGYESVPGLAKAADCTRQAIYPYLTGDKSQIDTFLLFQLAEACNVSVRWLFTGQGPMGRYLPLGLEEMALLTLFNSLPDALKEAWITHGEALRSLTPTAPSKEFPYKAVKK